jgi:hypothetical protein
LEEVKKSLILYKKDKNLKISNNKESPNSTEGFSPLSVIITKDKNNFNIKLKD